MVLIQKQPPPSPEPPQAPPDPAPHPQATPPTAISQVMDVVPPPPEEPDESDDAKETPTDKPKDKHGKSEKLGKPKAQSTPKSGVALAIVATVIIVLGLAALATYAYLKTR